MLAGWREENKREDRGRDGELRCEGKGEFLYEITNTEMGTRRKEGELGDEAEGGEMR